MTRNNFIALCGVAAIVVVATAWSSTQEKDKPQQPKSQVVLEKEYYTRILPRLERDIDALRLSYADGRASGQELFYLNLELLFVQRRCGKVTEEQFEAKWKPFSESATAWTYEAEKALIMTHSEAAKKLRRLDWFAVFGKADLNTPVGIPPWAMGFK